MVHVHPERGTQRMVEPGDHLVVLYREESEVVDTVVAFIQESLSRQEKCIYITGDADTELILSKLNLQIDTDYFINRGQLALLEKDDAYSKDGKFVPDRMVELLISETNKAIEEGYEGLSISGEISWVLEYENGIELIVEYEWKINDKVFHKYPIAALCRYNMDKFPNDMIINIIQVHPYLSIGNKVYENPFYLPADGYKADDISEFQIQTWLDNIVKFTNTKSKFHQQIKSQEQQYNELFNNIKDEIILSIIGLLEIHDEYTKSHSEDVALMAKQLAYDLGLEQEYIDKSYYAGLVHDIGKIIVPKNIISKKGKLTEEEMDIIKQHSEWGYKALLKSRELLDIGLYVRHHHERFDGSGYPGNLQGENIPIISRILSVIDAYDAMIHSRPYRNRLTLDEAKAELIKNKGTQFDPFIVDTFLKRI